MSTSDNIDKNEDSTSAYCCSPKTDEKTTPNVSTGTQCPSDANAKAKGNDEMISMLLNNVLNGLVGSNPPELSNVLTDLVGSNPPELSRMKTNDDVENGSNSSDCLSEFSEPSSEADSIFNSEERRQYNIQLLLLAHCELSKAVCRRN